MPNRYFITIDYQYAGFRFAAPCRAEAETLTEAESTVREQFASSNMPDAEILTLRHTDTVHNVGQRGKRRHLI